VWSSALALPNFASGFVAAPSMDLAIDEAHGARLYVGVCGAGRTCGFDHAGGNASLKVAAQVHDAAGTEAHIASGVGVHVRLLPPWRQRPLPVIVGQAALARFVVVTDVAEPMAEPTRDSDRTDLGLSGPATLWTVESVSHTFPEP
jgi:hypothetical protein